MSTITIPLPEEDLSFLRSYASAQGTSVEEYFARQARNLRERLQQPLNPLISEATGILLPGVGEQDHLKHLEQKHR